MKRILLLAACLCSFSAFAANMYSNCPQSLPTSDIGFCPSFKSVAECHCVESGLPKSKCKNMRDIYLLMIARFGTIQKACEFQHDTPTQVCVDDWNCYRSGGRDSQGKLCSTTGNACPALA